MSRVFHTSDWHLGHKSILKYRDVFSSIKEHNEIILDNYTSMILKRDTVYFHGDICFDRDELYKIKSLKGHKVLIMGNHDTDYLSVQDLIDTFDKVYSLKNHKGSWLSHAPVHPSELRGKVNIHGHSHNRVIDDSRYINVCLEQTDFKPISGEAIKEMLNG